MKKTEYIEIKRQYTPPEIRVMDIGGDAGILYESGFGTGGDVTKDPEEEGGGNEDITED